MGHVVQLERVFDHRVRLGFGLHHVAVAVIETHGNVVRFAGERDRAAGFQGVLAAGLARLRMDQRRARLDRLCRVGEDGQVFVLHFDQPQRREGDLFGLRRHRGDLVAQAAHLVRLQRQVILGHAYRALIDDVRRGNHRMHTGQCLGRRGVDVLDAGMHALRAQDLAVELPRQIDVVDIARLAAGLLRRVHFRDALDDEGAGLDEFCFFSDLHDLAPGLPVRLTEAIASTILV